MTTLQAYENKVAQSIPGDAILGSLIWFSISNADVSLDEAREALTTLGLSTGTLRRRLRAIDAFKKASNSLARSNLFHSDGIESNFLVRQVGQDADASHRHVILERVSTQTGKRRKLSYDKVAELVYTRGAYDTDGVTTVGDSLEVNATMPAGLELSKEEQAWLDANLPVVHERVEHWKTHLDSHAVRSFVREYIYLLAGTCVRESGGVYFISQKHAETISKLTQWVRSIGSDLHSLPLLDLVDQREMLLRAFEEETMSEVDRLSGEMSKILGSDKSITQATFDSYIAQAVNLMAKSDEYAGMLNARLDDTNIRLEMFKRQTLTLSGRVKQPKGRRGA
jgi:hypothetical protein